MSRHIPTLTGRSHASEPAADRPKLSENDAERRGLRFLLYFTAGVGLIWLAVAYREPSADAAAGWLTLVVSVAGLAASCRPVR